MYRRGGVAAVLVALLVSLFVIAIIIGGCGISGYNRVLTYDETVNRSWADVESQLQRRFDLVPNLVETVKGSAAHESEVIENIAQARTQYMQASQSGSREDQIKAASLIGNLNVKMLRLAEQYPDLKAMNQFQDLMVQLEGTENRINRAREKYNEAVEQLNSTVRRFPGSLFASLAGVDKAPYFEATEAAAEAPTVDFGEGEADGAAEGEAG